MSPAWFPPPIATTQIHKEQIYGTFTHLDSKTIKVRQ